MSATHLPEGDLSDEEIEVNPKVEKKVQSTGILVKTDELRSTAPRTSKVAFTDKDGRSLSATVSSSSDGRPGQSLCELPLDMECDKFLSVEDFSQNLVDRILGEAVFKVDIMTSKLEVKSISGHELSPLSSSPRSVSSESSSTLGSTFEINWPSIGDFNIGVGTHIIEDYLSLWYLEENWKYYVEYTKHINDRFVDLYHYEAIFSIPVQLYPVAQVTATMYFIIEVSRYKPSWSLVDPVVFLTCAVPLVNKMSKAADPKERLNKHYIEFEIFLKRAKKDFEAKYSAEMKENASLSEFGIIKTLGAGAFGRVVLVKRKGEDKLFAMKSMEKQHIVKSKQVQHTMYEIRVLNAVRFDFLVNMEYFFKDNVYLFLVMPFINGGEMFGHLRNLKKFDETLSKFYASQVILAFEYIHYLGMVYRDLKPENILLDKDGYIKVTDLGFCKKIDDQRTYTLCGTPEYLAPEVILSQGYNKSVDYWALGVLIYEMSAGYPPFYARDPMKIYEKIVSGKFTCPPHFSKPLKDLCGNLIQVDRTKRYGILKNGTKDIKGHEWFRSIDWDHVLRRKIKPTYKPKVSGTGDTSNFDYYEEEPFRTNSTEEFPYEFAVIKT